MKYSLAAFLTALLTAPCLVAWAQDGPGTPAPATGAQPAVLTIGAAQWPARRFGWLLEAAGLSDLRDPGRLAAFIDTYQEHHLLAEQAEAAGLAADARVAERLAQARHRILAEEERHRLRAIAPVDEAALRADFSRRPRRFDELRLSHILVRVTEADASLAAAQRRTAAQALARAQSLRRQLKAGANFANLARRHSDDVASRADGGMLPSIFAKDLKPAVAPAVASLAVDEVSEPVRSPDGYHLIRVEQRTAAHYPDIRALLEFDLQDTWAKQQVRALKDATPAQFDLAAWQLARDGLMAGR